MKPSGKVTASDGEEDDNFGGSETAFVRELRSFHNAITTGVHPQDALGAATDLAWLQGMLSVLARRAASAQRVRRSGISKVMARK